MSEPSAPADNPETTTAEPTKVLVQQDSTGLQGGGLYAALRRSPQGSGASDVVHTLDALLANNDPDSVQDLVAQLLLLLPQIEMAQSGIAELQARSGRDMAALVTQAAEVRASLLTLQGELTEADRTSNLPSLLMKFRTLREVTAKLRGDVLADEAKFVANEGKGKADLVKAQGAAGNQVFKAELQVRNGETDQARQLGVAAAATEAARLEADALLAKTRAEAREAALTAQIASGTAELQLGLTVHGVAAEASHQMEAIAAQAEARRVARNVYLKPGIEAAQSSDDRIHNLNRNWLDRLNGGTPMLVALMAQIVSAYLSTKGIYAMSQNNVGEHSNTALVLPIGVAASLNLFMLYLTMSYHNHGWDFTMNPLGRDAQGGVGVSKNAVNSALFAATVLLTTGLGYAGAAADFVPAQVIGTAMEDRVNKARTFATASEAQVDETITAPTTQAVQDVIDAGSRMVDESLGRGVTQDYGFRRESIVRLDKYRTQITETVDELAELGACDGIEQLRDSYQQTMGVLQGQLDSDPSFADASFVRKDAAGQSVYDIDLSSHVEQCQEAHPESPKDLVNKVDALLQNIVTDVKGGAITDTSQLNGKIFELNDLMAQIQVFTGQEAPVLNEFDPMLVESIRILLDNVQKLVEQNGEHIAAWPFILVAIAGVIDQVGMLIAIVARGNKLGKGKMVSERVRELSSVDVDLEGLQKKQSALQRILARFAPRS